MDLLRRGDRGSRLAPSFTLEADAKQNFTDFLTVTRRMKLYENDELETLEKLSAGTSFQAEKCREVSTGSIVVVKKLHEVHDKEGGQRSIPRAVLEEMKISIWPPFLKHPNITRTLGYQSYTNEDGTSMLALVLEYSTVGTLEAFLEAGKLKDWGLKRTLALGVASGLEILHRYRVVHGDIKPSNILLFERISSDGSFSLLAKLSDFGNAIAENNISALDGVRMRSTYRGTALWEPPIARNYWGTLPFYVLPKYDVFSFGLVVWSIFKGGSYFEDEWRDVDQSEEECLDELGVSGLLQKFQEFWDANLHSLPEDLGHSVANLVKSCMWPKEFLEANSKALPKSSEGLLKESFTSIIGLRALLEEPQRQSQRYVVDNPWNAFDIGPLSIEGNHESAWDLQVGYREELLDIVQDNRQYEEARADAEMELACSASVGFGCRKSIEECLERVWRAALIGDIKAQMVVCRLYEAHGKEIPADLDSIEGSRDSGTPAESPEREEERENVEMSDDDSLGRSGRESIEVDGGYSTPQAEDTAMGDGEEDEMESEDSETSDREMFSPGGRPSFLKAYCELSKIMLEQVRIGQTSNAAWYNWHVRTFQNANATRPVNARVIVYGKEFAGLKDRHLLGYLEANWSRYRAGERIIQVCGAEGRNQEHSLLHWVVTCGHNPLFYRLFDLGFDVDAVDSDQLTLLNTACYYGNAEAAKFLITKGANATMADRGGGHPLHWLWMFEEPVAAEICDLLIKTAGADVNSSMDEVLRIEDHCLLITGTPLHAAVAARCPHAIELLIAHGANVNIRPTEDSLTPVELAAQLHCSEIVRLLLDRGARLEGKIPNGWALHQVGALVTPLYRWLLHGAEYANAASDVIKVLLEAGRKHGLDAEDEEDDLTALDFALTEKGEEAYIVESFLKCGVELGEDALDMALFGCASNELNASKVEAVLKRNPDREYDWADILRLAVDNGALEAIRVFSRHRGAHILSVRDDGGQTPLHWAARAAKTSIVKFLVGQNVPTDLEDKDGLTPVGCALLSRSVEVADELLKTNPRLMASGRFKGTSILVYAVSALPFAKSMLVPLLSDEDERRPTFQRLRRDEVLNAQDEADGNTVLHRAVISGDSDGVAALLEAKADCRIRNNRGQTALEMGEELLRRLAADEDEALGEELMKAVELLRHPL